MTKEFAKITKSEFQLMFKFLDELAEKDSMNMYGSFGNLKTEFKLGKYSARKVVKLWIEKTGWGSSK